MVLIVTLLSLALLTAGQINQTLPAGYNTSNVAYVGKGSDVLPYYFARGPDSKLNIIDVFRAN